MPADRSRVSPFGRHVRRWRAIRRMSQLDLAVAVGTTPRHLSFVETGRSRPRRDLILRIADALTVPLPERNTLLAAAGLPPAFPAHELGSHALEPVNRVLEKVLRGHEPYPAWVIRQPLTIVRANTGADEGRPSRARDARRVLAGGLPGLRAWWAGRPDDLHGHEVRHRHRGHHLTAAG